MVKVASVVKVATRLRGDPESGQIFAKLLTVCPEGGHVDSLRPYFVCIFL